jgi:hypothetical protein
MAKHYMFYRADIINLLLNYKSYLSKKINDAINAGEPMSSMTIGRTALWTEEFFDEQIKMGEVKLEHLLDEVDSIMEKTHGMTVLERAKQKVESEN